MAMRLLQIVREAWIKTQLNAPRPVQREMPHLHAFKEIARLLSRPKLTVVEMRGRRSGGSLTVVYAGLEYAKPFLKEILFDTEPEEQIVDRVPFWRCRELAATPSADILIVAGSKHLIRRLPRQRAIVMPEFVRHVLDVRGDWQDVQRRFRKTVHKNDLRRIRKFGYDYDVSHDDRHFREFYHQMYLPTMQARHESMSMPTDFDEAYQYFRHGMLFRIKRAGEWVAGGVCHAQGNALLLDVIGVRDADTQLIEEGAMAARYYAAIHWANRNGFKEVNFLGSSPFLSAGQFQYKRKWGTAIHVPPHLHRQIWMKINRSTPAVSQFLKANPFVVVDVSGNLDGLISVDERRGVTPEAKAEWDNRYATPGLRSLVVRAIDDFIDKAASTVEPETSVPLALQAGLENKR
jgi:hypothetical protein